MTRQLLSLQKPTAVILEGGYSPKLLAESSRNVVHALLGRRPPSDSNTSCSTSESDLEAFRDPEADEVLDAVRRRLNTLLPWSTLRRPGGTSDPYFHEASSLDAVTGSNVARKLTQLIRKQAVC